jgi:dihydrofolate reductase
MSRLTLDISVSLDGFVAGSDASHDQPLGVGGEQLHEWAYGTAAFRAAHGATGGDTGVDNDIAAEAARRAGATIMGRRMFSGGSGPWAQDDNADGWWGDTPPFHHPVFVLTHHAREPLVTEGTTFTFVTEGIEAALEQARAVAGRKEVAVGGGADVAQQYLRAGLLDEFQLHVAPVLLGRGVRLFGADPATPRLECTRVVASGAATHLRYKVVRPH